MRVHQHLLVGSLRVGDPIQRNIRVAQDFAVRGRKGRVFLAFEQVDDFLHLILVQQDLRKAKSRYLLQLVAAGARKQFLQHVGCILVAVLVHVQTRNGELRLRRVRRVGKFGMQSASDDFGVIEVAVNDIIGELLVQRRCLDL